MDGTDRPRSPTLRKATFSRRVALRHALLLGTGLVVIDPRGVWAWGEESTSPVRTGPALVARARSVIEVWMSGGPCHLDTFDPKPQAGPDYCGPLDQAIATSVTGMQIGALLPLLAKQAGLFSLIRSMTHGVNAHETASYQVQTGRSVSDNLVFPCLGSLVSLHRGYDRGYQGLIPPYIALTTPLGRFSESGFLGDQYGPFATGGDPNQKRFSVEGIVADGLDAKRVMGRRDLLRSLDSLVRAMPTSPQFAQFEACEKKADGTVAQAGNLFDLSGEKPEVRDLFGRNTFGQSCLMARRLVEHGVPYVQINYPGWDTHKQHFQTMNRKLPEFDRGLAALLVQLAERGLLESTIVWCTGEFGRTPRVQWQPPWNGGRGHHGQCFSALVAGGGFKGGHVVGATDAHGETVTERPVHPQDLLGSICKLMGIDPTSALPNERGLAVPVMPTSEGTGGMLEEIM